MTRKTAISEAIRVRLARFASCWDLEVGVDFAGLSFITIFLIGYFPVDVLTATMPATGGDTGSHYWSLHTLFHHGLFSGELRVWNPGNLAGEPHLVHYFPLPFIIMGLLAYLVPLHIAFNIGTMLCVLMLPLSVYFCLRMWPAPRPSALLGAAFSSVFLLTDTYSAWGGNLGSTLAGQFCHLYAICFMLLGVGCFSWEVRNRRLPLWSGLLFACVALSHGYILMLLPFVAIGLVICLPRGHWRFRLFAIVGSGTLAFALSSWWLLPMLDNNKWVTAYADKWFPNLKPHEYAPYSLYPIAILAILFLSFPDIIERSRMALTGYYAKLLAFLVFLLLTTLAMVVIFPRVGLVDIRAIPQAHLLICLIAAVTVGHFMTSLRAKTMLLLSVTLVLATVGWASTHGKVYKSWAVWNYESWNAKPLYKDLQSLSAMVKGDFNQPRIIFEHAADINNNAGTPRVFENLPYFANRATLESLYMQASPISGPIYAAQAMVSAKPSCPFPNFRCPPRNLKKQLDQLKLLGVGELILSSNDLVSEASSIQALSKVAIQGPWHLFKFNETVPLVRFFDQPPELGPDEHWQKDAYQWFLDYEEGKSRFRVVGKTLSEKQRQTLLYGDEGEVERWVAPPGCEAEVDVGFNGFKLNTSCPGVAHILKFSFNHSFVTSTNDQLFLVYPGFLGVIPSEREVEFKFGAILSWKIYSLVSLLTLSGWVILCLFGRRLECASKLQVVAYLTGR